MHVSARGWVGAWPGPREVCCLRRLYNWDRCLILNRRYKRRDGIIVH